MATRVDLEEVEDIFDVLERQRRDRIEMGNLPTGADGEPIVGGFVVGGLIYIYLFIV